MNENSPAEGTPLHSFSRSESADVRNVGTGQPRPGDEEGAPVLHSFPVQVNPALQPPQANPTLQQSSTQANPSLQPFIEGLNELGLAITEQQSQQFLRYQQELLDWNTRMNLTSITKPEEVLIKHFLDSLSLLMVYDAPAARVLDIGAGAGFPGLPLKILRPQWHIVLLEATGKKVRFLQHIIETLQLKDVVAVHGRAEELGHRADYRGLFDLVTARAVTSLPALIEYAAPFCCVGGQMVFPKKGDLAEELARGKRAASQLGTRFKADVQVM
ncbi:MAG TPA: 16S rRNA (guanine(527)-N(7))-methyltransferase RsmG, partial [Ktedonobacteraceae bacterium]|nr:16S rRNA (guanine(527)-N(7))-methyltransferase RsmG [Ktedonobacteraceae bacterium]